MRYIVSYDLIAASADDYQDLYDELEDLGGKRVLDSQWVVKRFRTSARNLRDGLLQFIKERDRLLVTELDGNDWASHNLKTSLKVS